MSDRSIQLQTTDGRLRILGGSVFCVSVMVFFTVAAVNNPDFEGRPDDQWGLAAVVIGVIVLRAIGRLRRSGLWVRADGQLLIRGAALSFTAKPVHAIDVLQVRSRRGGADLRLQVVGSSQEATGCCRLGLNAGGPPMRWPRSNQLLVREGGWRRGRWTPTGIAWADDDAFIGALAAYVDEVRGVPSPAAKDEPPHDIAFMLGAPAPTLAVAAPPDHLGQPVFRTSHSLVTRRGWRLRTLAITLGVVAWLSLGFIQFSVAVGAITVSAGFGALWLLRRASAPQLSVATRQRLQSRSWLRTYTPKPASFVVIHDHGDAVVAAVDPRGRSVPLSPLVHHSGLDEPNELLVRYPGAARDSDSDWHGTGVFWESDASAIRDYLQDLLRQAA